MRKKTTLIVVVILAIGLVGTGLSTLYWQNGQITYFNGMQMTYKESYGFPIGWYGYTQTEGSAIPINGYPKIFWFSIGPFLLDAAFWFAISFFVSLAAIKSVTMLHKTRASKNKSVINVQSQN